LPIARWRRSCSARASSTTRKKYLKQLADDRKDPQSVLALADYYVMAGRTNDAIAPPGSRWPRMAASRPDVKLRLARAYGLGGQSARAKSLIDAVLKEKSEETRMRCCSRRNTSSRRGDVTTR
jgi:thioredoxin-like negative regulator of GroEL